MADNTCIKQMKMQLQQATTTVMDVQTRVESIEDAIRMMVDKKLEEALDRLCGDMRAIRSERR